MEEARVCTGNAHEIWLQVLERGLVLWLVTMSFLHQYLRNPSSRQSIEVCMSVSYQFWSLRFQQSHTRVHHQFQWAEAQVVCD